MVNRNQLIIINQLFADSFRRCRRRRLDASLVIVRNCDSLSLWLLGKKISAENELINLSFRVSQGAAKCFRSARLNAARGSQEG